MNRHGMPGWWTIGVLVTLVLAGCAAPGPETADVAEQPRFEGTGPHGRPVATSSADAQVYFDQGLAFLHAFNHDEAIRSFRRAVELDPECAMAHWGVAYANGPHINNPVVPEEREAEAYASVQEAARLAATMDESADRALIEALATRYASPQPEDRGPLDQAFADAMAAVYARYPEDGDVGAIYAEALMDLHPWDLYEQDETPKEWTPGIVALLEEVLARHPDHPLAIHLYIHAVEGSTAPERALAPADRLRDLTPGLGHLAHMPSHIDVRTGQWKEAIVANTKAIEADDRYRAATRVPPDFYRLYMSHNHHMRAFAAMMTGRSADSIAWIRTLVDDIPEDWLEQNAFWADGFIAMPYEVLMRFGKWNEILEEPEPAGYLPFTRAMRHAARAVALGVLDRTEEARAEQAAFLEARAAVPEDAPFGNNTAHALLDIADRLVEGEVAYREGDADGGIAALYEAAELEAALRYDEPPSWIQPIRHALGATLMQERRFADAERAYREDLETWPENGWSLYGLARALELQGKTKESAEIQARFEAVWSDADIELHSSCFCQPGV